MVVGQIWSKIRTNLRDAQAFGPSFLLRHGARLSRVATIEVNIPAVGPVHLRRGESDLETVRQVFAAGDYDLGADSPVERRIKFRYQEILSSGSVPVIVDAGANIGAASLWFLTKYPRAAIVAVEPEPKNCEILRLNLAARENAHILEAAIGPEEGHVAIEGDHSGWGARTTPADHGIPVVTVQQALATVEHGVPFIVKIDIEGFEDELFSSNLGWIERPYVVIVEPHDWMLPGRKTSLNFQRAMAQHEFEIFLSGENLIYVRV